MKFSAELHQFLGQLHQDAHLMDDATEWFTDILVGLGRARAAKLASFLDELLAQPYEIADLENQWRASQAEIAFSDTGQIPQFLDLIRVLARTQRVTSSPLP